MKIDKNIKAAIIQAFRNDIEEHKEQIDKIVARMAKAQTVEALVKAKGELAEEFMESFPIGNSNNCYFCQKHDGDCRNCAFGKVHGDCCEDDDSTFSQITYAKDIISAVLRQYGARVNYSRPKSMKNNRFCQYIISYVKDTDDDASDRGDAQPEPTVCTMACDTLAKARRDMTSRRGGLSKAEKSSARLYRFDFGPDELIEVDADGDRAVRAVGDDDE